MPSSPLKKHIIIEIKLMDGYASDAENFFFDLTKIYRREPRKPHGKHVI